MCRPVEPLGVKRFGMEERGFGASITGQISPSYPRGEKSGRDKSFLAAGHLPPSHDPIRLKAVLSGSEIGAGAGLI